MEEFKILSCIVCEDFRNEIYGKASLIGYIGITPHASINLKDPEEPLERLSFVFTIDKGDGACKPKIIFTTPENETLFDDVTLPETKARKDTTSNLILAIRNIKLNTLGTYRIDVFSSDRMIFKAEFDVVHRPEVFAVKY